VPRVVRGWKLFRVRRDGSLGSLFINRRARIPLDCWLPAESHPTKGYKHRPYWHCLAEPHAPHLTEKGRQWFQVALKDVVVMERPEAQGGVWYLAESLKIISPVLLLTKDRHL